MDNSRTDLCTEIISRREERLKRRGSKAYARNNPIASDIDPDSCLRRQVLEIVAWQDKPLLDDPWLQGLFEAGNENENLVVQHLLNIGFKVIHQQVPFELKHRETGQLCLRGNIDGAIEWGGARPKFEVKLVSAWDLKKIYSIDDLLNDFWKKRYVAQMQAYLIGHAEETGLFILTNGRGEWKTLPVELDYEFAERIWSFAESIVEAVEINKGHDDRELPAHTEDQEQCEKCAFFGRTCNPEIKNKGAMSIQSGELEDLLAEREKVLEQGKQYDKLDKAVKKKLKEMNSQDRMIIGAWTVEWKPRNYRQKTVEPEVIPAHTVWVPKIEYVGD